jgi:hypothetical protein
VDIRGASNSNYGKESWEDIISVLEEWLLRQLKI